MSLGPRTKELLSIGAGPLATGNESPVPIPFDVEALGEMLERLNGFIAFESALVVRGFGDESGDLDGWNALGGWRSTYEDLADGLYFFAEDIFGGQFALENGGVVTFDPETGLRKPFASNVEDWADQLLDDYDFLTGYSLAHEWQQMYGQIPLGTRLVPRQPFILEGDFAVSNLRAVGDAEGMRDRARLANLLRNVPDGGEVVWPPPKFD